MDIINTFNNDKNFIDKTLGVIINNNSYIEVHAWIWVVTEMCKWDSGCHKKINVMLVH